jgi:hypothetical protein
VENDPEKHHNIPEQKPKIAEKLEDVVEKWEIEVVSELPKEDDRLSPIGHANFKHTQIPTRDGVNHGNIGRSNRFPNSSYFMNWTSIDDKIT